MEGTNKILQIVKQGIKNVILEIGELKNNFEQNREIKSAFNSLM